MKSQGLGVVIWIWVLGPIWDLGFEVWGFDHDYIEQHSLLIQRQACD